MLDKVCFSPNCPFVVPVIRAIVPLPSDPGRSDFSVKCLVRAQLIVHLDNFGEVNILHGILGEKGISQLTLDTYYGRDVHADRQ